MCKHFLCCIKNKHTILKQTCFSPINNYTNILYRLAREKISFQQRLAILKKDISSHCDSVDFSKLLSETPSPRPSSPDQRVEQQPASNDRVPISPLPRSHTQFASMNGTKEVDILGTGVGRNASLFVCCCCSLSSNPYRRRYLSYPSSTARAWYFKRSPWFRRD